MGGKYDNKEWDLDWENLFPRVSGYERMSDIKEVEITEIKVYSDCENVHHLTIRFPCLLLDQPLITLWHDFHLL